MKIDRKIVAKFSLNEIETMRSLIDFLNNMNNEEFDNLSTLFLDEINVEMDTFYHDATAIYDYMLINQD